MVGRCVEDESPTKVFGLRNRNRPRRAGKGNRPGIRTNSLKVLISSRDSTCDECGENLGRGAWITPNQDGTALCLPCADLDHLIFLASGDAALTRRVRTGGA